MAKSKAKAAKAGSTAAVATVSPYLQRLIQDAELRNKVLDALFGAEEEFDYQSTTVPAPPPPTPAATGS